MRVILDGGDVWGREVTDDGLAALYAPPSGAESATGDGAWWRANMVTSLDGSGVDASGHSAGLGSDADHRVFHLLRSLCDAVVVGAGTARAEEYGLAEHSVLVVVSRRGEVPVSVAAALQESERSDAVLLATCEAADAGHLAGSRELLGDGAVLVCPGVRVDPAWLRAALAGRGLLRVLSEGGPSLLGDAFAAGVVDELCLTISPLVAGGDGRRIVAHAGLGDGVRLTLASVIEAGGMLLTRWRVGGRRVGPPGRG